MTETTHNPGTLTKDDVVRWLTAEADSYGRDAGKLETSDDPDLVAVVTTYLDMAAGLREAGRRFAEHGPLPPLSAKWYAHRVSGAARCHPWPEGCGERARYVLLSGRGEVAVRHRDGCAVKAALDADRAKLEAELAGEDLPLHSGEGITGMHWDNLGSGGE